MAEAWARQFGHARYDRPGPARIRVTPRSKLHATLAVHDWLLLPISRQTGVVW
jgi:hypothetical protein